MNTERELVPPPALADDAHKGDAGRVLCLVGSETMPGAAILVARAAQRAGAGLVAVGCLDAALLTILPPAAPEAVLVDLTETFERSGRARSDAAERLRAREPHAVLIGPGLGDDARTRAVVELVLATFSVPLVLDADALNALAGRPERLAAAAGPIVITPHPLEAARLLGHGVPRDDAGRRAAAVELARRTGAVVCLKGRGTVLAEVRAGAERVRVNTTGNPGLATAGSGDVLAGILVAYLALASTAGSASWTFFDAAAGAVYVHGLAGDLAAGRLGRRGLIASDVIDALPEAQQRFEGSAQARGR